MLRLPLLIISILVISGCATAPAEPHIQNVNGLMVVSTTADVEGLIIKDRSSTEQMCAGRMVNVSDTSDVSLGVSEATTAESIGESSGVVTLGGINPAVHMTSELMYRACELSLNLNLSDKDSAEIYDAMIAAVVTISSHYSTSSGTKSIVSSASYMENTKASGAIDTSNGAAGSAVSTNTQSDGISDSAAGSSSDIDSTDAVNDVEAATEELSG